MGATTIQHKVSHRQSCKYVLKRFFTMAKVSHRHMHPRLQEWIESDSDNAYNQTRQIYGCMDYISNRKQRRNYDIIIINALKQI